MRKNESLIGGLIGVHASSIVNSGFSIVNFQECLDGIIGIYGIV